MCRPTASNVAQAIVLGGIIGLSACVVIGVVFWITSGSAHAIELPPHTIYIEEYVNCAADVRAAQEDHNNAAQVLRDMGYSEAKDTYVLTRWDISYAVGTWDSVTTAQIHIQACKTTLQYEQARRSAAYDTLRAVLGCAN